MIGRVFGVLTCALLVASWAQSGLAKGKSKAAGHTTTVTGCLAQGDEANEYSIKGDDGKTYGLRSSAVNLKEHLSHKVTVTGTSMHEKPEKHEAKTGMPEESAHLKVTNLTMVSTTCP